MNWDAITAISTVCLTLVTFWLAIIAFQAKNTWQKELKHKYCSKLYKSIKNAFRDANTIKNDKDKNRNFSMGNKIYNGWDDFFDNNEFVSDYMDSELYLSQKTISKIEDFRHLNFDKNFSDQSKIQKIIAGIAKEMKNEMN